MTHLSACLSSVVLLVLAPVAARAEDRVPAPTGEVVLEISGKITKTNAGDRLSLDLAQLRALPMVSVETATPATGDAVHVFEGIQAAVLLGLAGTEGTELRMTALDDYSVTAPIAGILAAGGVFALSMDGAPLDPEGFGPVWLLYDYDGLGPEKAAIVNDTMSPWALATIVVE